MGTLRSIMKTALGTRAKPRTGSVMGKENFFIKLVESMMVNGRTERSMAWEPFIM